MPHDNIKEEFKTLIHIDTTIEKLTEFLKPLDAKERKSLVPLIKTIDKALKESVSPEEGNYNRKGTVNQIELMRYTGYYCMGYRDYKRMFWSLPGRNDFFEKKIHQDFRPVWLEKYLNEEGRNIKYKNLINILQEGWFTPTKELIVQLLPNAIHPFERRYSQSYSIEALLKYQEVTLKEHIWYLFELPSNLNWSDRWVYKKDEEENRGWKETFESLIQDGRIERMRVLRECLLTSTRGFDKNLTGWFMDLFLFLQPTEQELLDLQDELLLTFNGAQSKPVNVSLKIIKKLCVHKDFKTTNFLEQCPVSLASDVKAMVNNTLMILDKVAKKQKDKQAEICLIASQALMQNDEKIQVRAAKLLQKYGSLKDAVLQQEIAAYQTDLFSEAKSILSEYLVETDATNNQLETYTQEILPKIREDNQILKSNDLDDLVFFFSQCFDNKEVYHFDLFVDYLPQLINQLNEDNFSKIEPAFHRAFKQVGFGSTGSGQIESLMANTFLDTILCWIDKEGVEDKNGLAQTYQQKVEEEKKWLGQVRHYRQKFVATEKIVPYYDNYFPFIQRLIYSKKIAFSRQPMPMLATPTHTPSWIELDVLVERLAFYQKMKVTPDIFDFQIGLSRVVIEKEATSKIKEKLSGEYFDILNYLVTDIDFDTTKCQNPNLWVAALYRKNKAADLELFLSTFDPENRGQLLIEKTPWICSKFTYEAREWDYKLREQVPIMKEKIELQITRPSKKIHPTLQAQYFPYQYEGLMPFQYFLFYGNFDRKKAYVNNHFYEHDEIKELSLSPFQPALVLEQWINSNLKSTNWSDSSADRIVPRMLTYLSDIWDDFDEMTYLFVACCLLNIKKEARQMAAEVWIQTNASQQMDNALLGHCLGKLQHGNYAPMKRFTDLLNNRMLNISSTHNQGLEILLFNMIPLMNDQPIKGTKKLLEIYKELLTINSSKATAEVLAKLEMWQSVASLKKIGKAIAQF